MRITILVFSYRDGQLRITILNWSIKRKWTKGQRYIMKQKGYSWLQPNFNAASVKAKILRLYKKIIILAIMDYISDYERWKKEEVIDLCKNEKKLIIFFTYKIIILKVVIFDMVLKLKLVSKKILIYGPAPTKEQNCIIMNLGQEIYLLNFIITKNQKAKLVQSG